MIARSGVAGLITGVIGGFICSLYIIYESLLHPELGVLLNSLATAENFVILTILTLSFGAFGFGIGYYLEKRNEKFKL
jgi:uncharacterized membrane protein